MKPDVDEILGALFQRILFAVIPHIAEEYAARDASVLGVMLTLCAQEYERAAEIRVQENTAMRALFEKAAPHVQDASLAEALKTGAALEAESFRISHLNATNQTLQKSLIRLHAYVEAQDAAWARALDKEILAFLRQMAEGRLVSFQL